MAVFHNFQMMNYLKNHDTSYLTGLKHVILTTSTARKACKDSRGHKSQVSDT